MSRTPRTVLLTGATGGIGRALAKRLRDDGYHLVLTDLVSCDDVIEAGSLQKAVVYAAPCDLSSAEDVARFFDDLSQSVSIDVLINNAAYTVGVPFDELTSDDLEVFFRINVGAPLQLSQLASKDMRQRGWGRIVNVVSGSAWAPYPTMVGYIASKMGLVGLTRSVAVELAPYGICVNAITPGLTRHAGIENKIPEALWEIEKSRQAIKRTGKPEDMVGAVAFLVSDDAGFMTGQTMVVDGGQVFL